jgi:hypothetical protein
MSFVEAQAELAESEMSHEDELHAALDLVFGGWRKYGAGRDENGRPLSDYELRTGNDRVRLILKTNQSERDRARAMREGEDRAGYRHAGDHVYLRWQEQLRWFKAQDRAWERQRRQARLAKTLRCKAPAKGKAGKAGELCGKPITDAQKVTKKYCSTTCENRAKYHRRNAAKTTPLTRSVGVEGYTNEDH